MKRKKVALLSVFHKAGIVEFAKALILLGYRILASGGTAKTLKEAGVFVRDVSSLVGGKAILGHKVVTLSRELHAGLLASLLKDDREEMKKLKLPYIDLVCVDLYPLEAEIKKPDHTPESVIDKTDIGGPTMLRSGAKGRRIVICDPADRQRVLDKLTFESLTKKDIRDLAAKAEYVVAGYCLMSAAYTSEGQYRGFVGEEILRCLYGENAPMVPAGLYRNPHTAPSDPLSLDKFKLVSGSSPSYNNLCDLDRLLQTATHIAATFDVNRGIVPQMAIGVKHGNACGAAIGSDHATVIEGMIVGDPLALFGGLVMVNFPIEEKIADLILTFRSEKRRILDGIIAPDFSSGAIEMLKRKGDKCRFLANPALSKMDYNSLDHNPRFRFVRGGFLSQPNYTFILNLKDPSLIKYGELTIKQENSLFLAKSLNDTSNSNTITIVLDDHSIGNAVGQQARVRGCNLGINLAGYSGHQTENAVAASDSFFPFPDGIEVLASGGIKAILTTSGSVNDHLTLDCCQQNGIVLYMIPDKIGRGFFGH
jgi:phosphoribosylaminoimidazolecarboxamide formyltransferase / IMP cyclohydrolase